MKSDLATSAGELRKYLPRSDVWFIDFEFEADDGERQHPLCLVGIELHTGREVKLWRHELYAMSASPFPDDALVVAFFASAEIGCYLALGWPTPKRVIDLYIEVRNQTNGLEGMIKPGLVRSCFHFNVPMPGSDEKGSNRALILGGGPWTKAQEQQILNYCRGDVVATRNLFVKLLPNVLSGKGGPEVSLKQAMVRGIYTVSVAEMEFNGVPIDVETMNRLKVHWETIITKLVSRVDADFDCYVKTTFKEAKFEAFLKHNGLLEAWPRLETGRPDLADETFKMMTLSHPELHPLHQLRGTLAKFRRNRITIGKDGRNRCLLSPFASSTGRNQPSNSRFIFGPSKWLRHLIVAPPGRSLIIADFSAQEICVAAALSKDPNLVASYASGDPYLSFAKLAGLVPSDATKKSHKATRDACKAIVLGTLYGAGPVLIGLQAGIPEHEAADLLRRHRETYPVFWRWTDENAQQFSLTRRISTVFGWQMFASRDWRHNQILNFPMQSHGAEILRVACILMSQAGLKLLAPVHDALVVECSVDNTGSTAAQVESLMVKASSLVLGTEIPKMRVEATILAPGERHAVEEGKEMFNLISGLLREAETEAFIKLDSPGPSSLKNGPIGSDSGQAPLYSDGFKY